MITKKIIYLVFFCFVMAGCDILGIHDDKKETVNNADIVLGKRVLDVKLGDSVKTVINQYGVPDSLARGTISGVYREWWALPYYFGPLAGIEFQIWADMTEGGLRYALGNGIIDRISINNVVFWKGSAYPDIPKQPTFYGKTKDGIQIGSSKEKIKKELGDPDYRFPDISGDVWGYCKEGYDGKNEVVFTFYADTARRITIKHGKKLWGKFKDCNWEKYDIAKQ